MIEKVQKNKIVVDKRCMDEIDELKMLFYTSFVAKNPNEDINKKK